MMCNVEVAGGGDAPRPDWRAWEGCYVSVGGAAKCRLVVRLVSVLVSLTADNSTLNPPSFRDSRHIQPVFLLPRSSFQLYSCGAQSGLGSVGRSKHWRAQTWLRSTHRHSAAPTLLCSDDTGGSSNSPPSLSLTTQTSETKTEEMSEVHRRQPGLRCRVFC